MISNFNNHRWQFMRAIYQLFASPFHTSIFFFLQWIVLKDSVKDDE